jgi:DNA-binding transcriptional regulator YdaS (Cro superfamily)
LQVETSDTLKGKDVITKLKGLNQSEIARQLGIRPQAVQQWFKTKVPAERCPDIERISNGEVTCEELRPDVNWAVLRNSAK